MTFSRSSLAAAQSLSCDRLWDPVDCSMPGSSAVHYLLSLLKLTSIETVVLSNQLLYLTPKSWSSSWSPSLLYLLFAVSFHVTIKNSDMTFPPESTVWMQALLWAPGPVPDCLPGSISGMSHGCLKLRSRLDCWSSHLPQTVPSFRLDAKPCATLLQFHGM